MGVSWVALGLLGALPPKGEANRKDLEEPNRTSAATEEGRKCEQQAEEAFFGHARFMGECAPVGAPVAEPLLIPSEVGTDGRMGRLVIEAGLPPRPAPGVFPVEGSFRVGDFRQLAASLG